jgi:hypothetical protein
MTRGMATRSGRLNFERQAPQRESARCERQLKCCAGWLATTQ